MSRFVLIVVFVATQFEAGLKTKQTSAEATWEKVIAAKGGKERLHRIENVLRSSRIPARVRFRSLELRNEELFALPNRLWHWSDERPTVLGLHLTTIDLETMRRFSAHAGEDSPRKLQAVPIDRRRLELMQAVELLDTRWVHLRPERTWSERKFAMSNLGGRNTKKSFSTGSMFNTTRNYLS